MKRFDEDELFERLLAGEWELEGDEARAFFAEHPEARARFDELQQLAADFGDLGQLRREVLAECDADAGAGGAPGEAAVRARILEQVDAAARARPAVSPLDTDAGADASEARGPRSLARSLPWLLTAASVLFAAFLWFRDDTPAEPGARGEVTLGDGVELVHPVGEVDTFGTFEWNHELERGGWFEIHVYDQAGELLYPPRGSRPRLTEARWTPPDDVRARFTDSIRWTVAAYSGVGVEVASGTGDATR